MNVEVVREAAVAKEVVGEVIAVAPNGGARRLLPGDRIEADEIIITANKAQIVMDAAPVAFELGENCVACQSQDDLWATAPLAEEVNFDLSQIDGLEVGEDEFAAIQQAILDGADPTAILEATAAGLNGLSSSISGLATIEATGVEVLASTLFETSGIDSSNTGANQQDGLRPFIFAAGGESLQTNLVEGNLSQGSYPVSSVSTATIFAGGLALDPDSFVPNEASLSSLLAELNADITSYGQAISFSYNESENSIVGELDGRPILTIDIDTTSVGKDVELTLTTILNEPIDHQASIGGGQVAFSGDQIAISLQVEGTDVGGNLTRLPVDLQVTIDDGVDPTINDVPGLSLDEAQLDDGSEPINAPVEASGQINFSEGGDYVDSFKIDIDEFNNDGSLTSGGAEVELREEPAGSGNYLGFTNDGGEKPIFTLLFDDTTLGKYTFTLIEALDHVGTDYETLTFELPV